jgi:hypothetical protein
VRTFRASHPPHELQRLELQRLALQVGYSPTVGAPDALVNTPKSLRELCAFDFASKDAKPHIRFRLPPVRRTDAV